MLVPLRRLLLPLLLVAVAAPVARAFPPTDFWANQAGDGTVSHETMTRVVIASEDERLFGQREPGDPGFVLTTPMKEAIQTMVDANAAVDDDQETSAKHFDCENFNGGRGVIGGQQFLVRSRNLVRVALERDQVDLARRALGEAFHAVQDFYAHTNWVELGRADPHSQLGRRGRDGRGWMNLPAVAGLGEATCEPGGGPEFLREFQATGRLTSGYYGGEDLAKPVLASGEKCNHGGLRDSGAGSASQGVAKDTTNSLFAPRHLLHSAAVDLAAVGTLQFVRDVLDDLTVAQTRTLLGARGPTLTFVFDTTGSMGEVIDRVKARATEIVRKRVGTIDEPVTYMLVPYGDPNVSLIIVDTADEFIDVINGLRPAGGGDCPELAMTATQTALSATPEGGSIFLFTDASAKDSGLRGRVSSLAASKRIKVRFILFGSCSPIDPAYHQVAAASGGQVFELAPSEAGEITRLADLVLRPSAVDVLSITDDLAAGPRSYDVPVDGTMTRLVVSVSGTADVTVRRPDGTSAGDGDPGVETVPLSNGALVGVVGPAPGVWTVALTGTGPFSVAVSGESALALDGFRFVELRGRPGHEGYFPIAGFPPAGEPSMVAARLSQAVPTARFELLAQDGTVLSALALEHGPGQPDLAYSGEVTLPDEPFLASVAGEDSTGRPFRRVAASVVTAQPLVVTPPEVGRFLIAGEATSHRFRVTNLGPAGEFDVKASDDGGYVDHVDPARVSLGPAESADVTVTLDVPAGADLPPANTLTVTAESTADDTVTNFAVLRSTIERRDDGDPCTVDSCDPRVGCLHPPVLGLPGLDCELAKLLAPDLCGTEPLGEKLTRALGRKVTKARKLVAKAGADGVRPRRFRRLLKRTDATLRKARKPVKRAARKEDVTAACGDGVLTLIAARREQAAGLRDPSASSTSPPGPPPGPPTVTTTTSLPPAPGTTTTTTNTSPASSSTTTSVTTTTAVTEITIIIIDI